jgi:phage replication O-like protein O
MKLIAPPNYTQVPNVILDAIAELEGSELAVVMVICRETFGWHRTTAELSLTDFEKATGLSRRGVRNAIDKLTSRQWISRTKNGQGARYEMMIELCQPVAQLQGTTVALSATVPDQLCHSVPQSLWQPVPQSPAPHIQGKKDNKEMREKESVAPTARVASATDSEAIRRKARHTEFIALWCGDYRAHFGFTYKMTGRDAKAVKELVTDSEEINALAAVFRAAWGNVGPRFWHSERSITIHYFAGHLNEVRSELRRAGSMKQEERKF